jgi:hypothetical protein
MNMSTERGSPIHGDKLSDQRLFSCVTCGILSFDCLAIIQPKEAASRYLMSADCSFFNDWAVGSGVTRDVFAVAGGIANISEQNSSSMFDGKTLRLLLLASILHNNIVVKVKWYLVMIQPCV